MSKTKADILKEAMSIVDGDRQNDYGDVEDNFQTIADLWNAYLSSKANRKGTITSTDVAVLMILLKCARISSGHHKDDNWIDIAGYAACGGSIGNRHITWIGASNITTDNDVLSRFLTKGEKPIRISWEKENK